MDIKFTKLGVVVLVAVLTLGALIGLQYGWKKYMLEDPTVAKLKAVQGVGGVSMGTQKPEQIVEIKLNNITNLKQTSEQLLKASGSAKIALVDNRSPELQALLDSTRFDIEEAIVVGNFTAMHQAIQAAADKAKLDRFAVYMDTDYIYLEFHKGEYNLYQVFARHQGKEQIFTRG